MDKKERIHKVAPRIAEQSTRLRIGFVLIPRFTLTAFAGFIDTLRLASDHEDWSRQIECQWAVLGDRDTPIVSSCGAVVQPCAIMENPRQFDYIVVVGGLLRGDQTTQSDTYHFLRDAARAGVSLIGLCTGSFILARAGLLKGYECCVSWFHREEFVGEFPTLRVQTNQLFAVDRDRLTCAGGISVVHLAAHVIEKHFGRPRAVKSLRILIEDGPLPAHTSQPESIVTHRARDSVVQRAMLIIEESLTEPIALIVVSRALRVSMRQLERRFISDIGIAPRVYRLRLRMARAIWLVEHTDRSVTDIALECGFINLSHFCGTFRKHFEVSPTEVRRFAHLADSSGDKVRAVLMSANTSK
jgi:transcriptional regulator GlxA family with amidase domain